MIRTNQEMINRLDTETDTEMDRAREGKHRSIRGPGGSKPILRRRGEEVRTTRPKGEGDRSKQSGSYKSIRYRVGHLQIVILLSVAQLVYLPRPVSLVLQGASI